MKDSFKQYFIELLGYEEASAFFLAIEEKKVKRTIRVNTLKSTKKLMKKYLSEKGYEVTDSPFSRDSLDIKGTGEKWSLKLPYHAGFTYPQDSSSGFVVDLLDPKPGEKVIDMTAAPGGKSTHIAQRMQNKGVLFANDMDTRRLKALHSNLERLGIWNTVVLRMNAHKLTLIYPEYFDRVLLDPSCSGEGLFNTYEARTEFWSLKAIKAYSQDQFSLLCSAFRLLKPGGRLVYSTCTLNAIEDDGVIEKLLKKFPQAEIIKEIPKQIPQQIQSLKGIRFWPHKSNTKGFFCIAIGKKESLGLSRKLDCLRTLKSASKKGRMIEKELFKLYGLNDFPWEWVERDSFLFAVSSEMIHTEFPMKHSLSFPIYKDGRLTHAAALWAGLHTKKCIHVDDLLKFFQNSKIGKKGYLKYELIKHSNFPLGIAKNEEGKLIPLQIKMF